MSLLTLPRELRDEIISYFCLPSCVYTSSSTPNPKSLHSPKVQPTTFVDTRIYLPCRISPNVLGVCHQLRDEGLQCHRRAMHASSSELSDDDEFLASHFLAERAIPGEDESAEQARDQGLRITVQVQRAQRGPFGYGIPVREELSPRFMALLPLIDKSRKLRIIVWAGIDWWNGSRPRPMTRINGRMRVDENAPAKPDAVSVAVSKVLEQLPAIEELEVDILAHIGDIIRWDLPDPVWANVQYWLDGPICLSKNTTLKTAKRRLAVVWASKKTDVFYDQQESRISESETWHIKRHGDVRTPLMMELAEEGELIGWSDPVDEEFDRAYQ